MEWDGKERRKVNTEDHDILVEIRSDLKNHLANYEERKRSNDGKFKVIFDKLFFHDKILYGCLGGWAVFQIILKVIK